MAKKKKPRYVDANLVKKSLLGWETDPTDEEIEYTIDNIPTADVVEVVRCKDCKKYKESKSFSGELKMYCDELSEDELMYMKPDDFCCYGERRDT